MDLTIGNEVTKALVETTAALSILNPTRLSILLSQSAEAIQMVHVSNQSMTISKSLPIPFRLNLFRKSTNVFWFPLSLFMS